MVCGNDNTGKDFAAEMLGRDYSSSSIVAMNEFIWEAWGVAKYDNPDDCFEDRGSYRDVWKTMIRAYSYVDETKLGRLIFSSNDIYVGVRSAKEFNALKEARLFDLSLWVDSSQRCAPSDNESNEITMKMCDWVIDNNGTEEKLKEVMVDVKQRVDNLEWAKGALFYGPSDRAFTVQEQRAAEDLWYG